MSEIPRAYEPGQIEKKWYDFWLEQGYFTPDIAPDKTPFVIVMPPPNVTGELHLGHALTATLEDIMVRWHRMKGESTLWLPGIDHAGIATQVVVERQLAKQGQTREQIGREEFTRLTWAWAEKSIVEIRHQHQLLGASCDWTREKFTLDEGPSRAVRTAFVRLYDKKLIYRGERMINWCPRCQTALSDLEVEHKDIAGHLYYIRYPRSQGEGFVTVATTRPETFLGDTAVAVHPEDARYRGLVGSTVSLPVINRDIPIIADDAVDASFGTGALKITPGHDPTDAEIARRHGLPLIDIMNPDATMNDKAGPYRGLERLACRDRVLADLKEKGLLEKTEPYSHSVGHCDRCQTMVEPRVSLQWFVQTQPLAGPAIKAVRDGRITIIPERFIKTYLHWMESIRDWCISRQLWWGHRIPVWYCQDCGKAIVAVEDPKACTQCGSAQLIQDPDVLDTWFSSALWTHSTLGWPDDTDDLRYFYPGSVMETAYDIIFFWVARMIMMGLENMGEIPFRTVYLHGLIRDESGEKMSRTKLRGKPMNPAEPISRYGVDALRFALTAGSTPGNDMNVGTAKFESGRNFVNKLWNASRFILQSLEAAGADAQTTPRPVCTTADSRRPVDQQPAQSPHRRCHQADAGVPVRRGRAADLRLRLVQVL
jgi:valyl-tRNA synthetase